MNVTMDYLGGLFQRQNLYEAYNIPIYESTRMQSIHIHEGYLTIKNSSEGFVHRHLSDHVA